MAKLSRRVEYKMEIAREEHLNFLIDSGMPFPIPIAWQRDLTIDKDVEANPGPSHIDCTKLQKSSYGDSRIYEDSFSHHYRMNQPTLREVRPPNGIVKSSFSGPQRIQYHFIVSETPNESLPVTVKLSGAVSGQMVLLPGSSVMYTVDYIGDQTPSISVTANITNKYIWINALFSNDQINFGSPEPVHFCQCCCHSSFTSTMHSSMHSHVNNQDLKPTLL